MWAHLELLKKLSSLGSTVGGYRWLHVQRTIYCVRKCQDMKTILKLEWEQKTGFFGYVPTQDIFTRH